MQSDVHFIPLAKEEWNPVVNIDVFLTNVYVYYQRRGVRAIIVQYICDIFGLFVILVITLILFQFINWHDVIYMCTNTTTCSTVSLFSETLHFGTFAVCYLIFLSLYIAYRSLNAFNHCIDILDVRDRLKHDIGISECQILSKSWNEVMELLVQYNRQKHFCIINPNLTQIDIINVMMRQSNFMVALVSNEILSQWYITDVFLNALERFVLRPMFTEHNRLIDTLPIKKIQKSLRIMGIIGLCISPITAIFMSMTYIVQHANDIKSRSADFLLRAHLTPGAKYYFGLFNELPHVLEKRIERVEPLAWQCFESHHTPIRNGILQCLLFVLGSSMVLLIAVSVVNEEALLHLYVHGYTLVWWMAVLSTGFAMCRYATQPASFVFPHYDMMNTLLGTSVTIRSPVHLKPFFRPQIVLILLEIAGCITTPLLFIFHIPMKLEEIFHFLNQVTMNSPHGDVVWYNTGTGIIPSSVSVCIATKLHKSYVKSSHHMSSSSSVLLREGVSSSLMNESNTFELNTP